MEPTISEADCLALVEQGKVMLGIDVSVDVLWHSDRQGMDPSTPVFGMSLVVEGRARLWGVGETQDDAYGGLADQIMGFWAVTKWASTGLRLAILTGHPYMD